LGKEGKLGDALFGSEKKKTNRRLEKVEKRKISGSFDSNRKNQRLYCSKQDGKCRHARPQTAFKRGGSQNCLGITILKEQTSFRPRDARLQGVENFPLKKKFLGSEKTAPAAKG